LVRPNMHPVFLLPHCGPARVTSHTRHLERRVRPRRLPISCTACRCFRRRRRRRHPRYRGAVEFRSHRGAVEFRSYHLALR
jgi:hypothetical protein